MTERSSHGHGTWVGNPLERRTNSPLTQIQSQDSVQPTTDKAVGFALEIPARICGLICQYPFIK